MFIQPFVSFKNLVENYFTTTITTLYTDNGGEFLALRSFLATHGISHLTTPPHTPEHNEYSKRRHRHIIETSLTLLHQAFIPLTFWSYAFATTICLINRMPKVGLSLGPCLKGYSTKLLTLPTPCLQLFMFSSVVSLFFPQTRSQIQFVCLSWLLPHSKCLSLL